MLPNKCYVTYVMLYNMLYDICYVIHNMLYEICYVMLYNRGYGMFITCVMFFYITYVI